MPKFHLTNKAVEDLSEIWDYTFEIWSEDQADKYYYELLADCQKLAQNQFFGRSYKEINKEIFGFKSGQHIIFYSNVNEDKIEIIRFLHSKMDLKNKIQE
ncbi:type II toxin-antitoxin system RelE/ParE family toxin [Flavobacterium restrictum]|uniref:Toxin n=1 Tax=Flavobacterium restrictum TaxID=2594428 RepID=A0A553E765_9FLAO|nr:type II toxin-antitoxin system RelE/ParE family toxin [Flavobacterium restrictum]TRX40832.1 type II toxin-antitoxin system RelE/ParE family toxin [Flavobacterium restrictum]